MMNHEAKFAIILASPNEMLILNFVKFKIILSLIERRTWLKVCAKCYGILRDELNTN